MMKNEYTELMWDYYRKNKKKIKTKVKNKKHYVYKENKKGQNLLPYQIVLDGLLNIHIKAVGCHRDSNRNTNTLMNEEE